MKYQHMTRSELLHYANTDASTDLEKALCATLNETFSDSEELDKAYKRIWELEEQIDRLEGVER